jgi:hypothetical protein
MKPELSSDIGFSGEGGDGPWRVVLWGAPTPNHWYIYNTETGQFRKVGPVRMSGTNYYDRAHALADRLNREAKEEDDGQDNCKDH